MLPAYVNSLATRWCIRENPMASFSIWAYCACHKFGNSWKIEELSARYWGELQPNIRKIPQSSLYSWTMYINKKIRCCHLMQFPCHKVAHAGNSTFSFSISAILHSCIFGYSCVLSANISITTWHPSIVFVGLSWFVSIGMHLGIF